MLTYHKGARDMTTTGCVTSSKMTHNVVTVKVDVIYDVLGACQGRGNTRGMYSERQWWSQEDSVGDEDNNTKKFRLTTKPGIVRGRRQRTGKDDSYNDNDEKAMLLIARRAYELGRQTADVSFYNDEDEDNVIRLEWQSFEEHVKYK